MSSKTHDSRIYHTYILISITMSYFSSLAIDPLLQYTGHNSVCLGPMLVLVDYGIRVGQVL